MMKGIFGCVALAFDITTYFSDFANFISTHSNKLFKISWNSTPFIIPHIPSEFWHRSVSNCIAHNISRVCSNITHEIHHTLRCFSLILTNRSPTHTSRTQKPSSYHTKDKMCNKIKLFCQRLSLRMCSGLFMCCYCMRLEYQHITHIPIQIKCLRFEQINWYVRTIYSINLCSSLIWYHVCVAVLISRQKMYISAHRRIPHFPSPDGGN